MGCPKSLSIASAEGAVMTFSKQRKTGTFGNGLMKHKSLISKRRLFEVWTKSSSLKFLNPHEPDYIGTNKFQAYHKMVFFSIKTQKILKFTKEKLLAFGGAE